MEITVQDTKKLDPGVHKGIIKEITYREKPYEYTDVHIELADKMVVKVGYPTMITPTNKLGSLLARFGATIEIGKNLDPEKILLLKECEFQSIMEGIYYKIIDNSVTPIHEQMPIKGQ